jgi:hypothetical protein
VICRPTFAGGGRLFPADCLCRVRTKELGRSVEGALRTRGGSVWWWPGPGAAVGSGAEQGRAGGRLCAGVVQAELAGARREQGHASRRRRNGAGGGCTVSWGQAGESKEHFFTSVHWSFIRFGKHHYSPWNGKDSPFLVSFE